MNQIKTLALTLIGVALLFSSCQKAPFVTVAGSRSYTFTREGGTQTFSFSCNRDWSLSSSESWIRVSPSSGAKSDNEVTVTIICSANTTYDPRNATITVRVEELTETISVTQETGLGLLVSPLTLDLTNAAQDIEIEVQKNVQYTVTIDEASKAWISQKGTKALSSEKVVFAIAANETYDNREGKITFKQTGGDLVQTVTVTQSQTNGLFITTPEYDLSNEAHTLSVGVKANVQFDVTSQADWIKFIETKALTPSTIVLDIEANESYDNRTGTVVVKQINGDLTSTITINQHQTDGLFVTPTSAEVSNAAQTVSLEIKDNVSYNVVIPDDAKSWISVQSNTQTKALNDDMVVLSIERNKLYEEREASITIKQVDGPLAETVKIIQQKAIAVSSISLDKNAIALIVGLTETLSATVLPENAEEKTISWTSSDPAIASVDQGVVKAHTKGRTTITATAGGVSISCSVLVQKIPNGAVNLGMLLAKEDGSPYYVFWAEKNIGADFPEDYGNYYAWGEVETKTQYDWSTYKWANGASDKLTKYCVSGKEDYWDGVGAPDNKTILDLEDDVANMTLGDEWRIPTYDELYALSKICTWTWKKQNGVWGYVLTSKVEENVSIFLPPAGAYNSSVGIQGQYWGADIPDVDYLPPTKASWLYFREDLNNAYGYDDRYVGRTIRAVSE